MEFVTFSYYFFIPLSTKLVLEQTPKWSLSQLHSPVNGNWDTIPPECQAHQIRNTAISIFEHTCASHQLESWPIHCKVSSLMWHMHGGPVCKLHVCESLAGLLTSALSCIFFIFWPIVHLRYQLIYPCVYAIFWHAIPCQGNLTDSADQYYLLHLNETLFIIIFIPILMKLGIRTDLGHLWLCYIRKYQNVGH